MKKLFAIVSHNTDLAFFAAYITVGESRIFFWLRVSKNERCRQLKLIRQSLESYDLGP